MKRLSLAALLLLGLASAQPAEDKFTSLKSGDQYVMPTDSYSGYLDVSDGKSLHYLLVESKNAPTTDPVVFWFNGGPGCSSMLGFMQENGPWVIDDFETELKENPFPWNSKANVVYLESPAGVGYSVGKTDADKSHNDLSSSVDNFKALELFFQKFPNLLTNEIYLTGESYAGLYVPYLAWQVYQHNLKQKLDPTLTSYNLKGFMVGNGATDWNFDAEPSFADTLYNFQLITPALYQQFNDAGCHYYHNDIKPSTGGDDCDGLMEQMNALVDGLNIYDLYRYTSPANQTAEAKQPLVASSPDRLATVTVDGTERSFKRGYTAAEYTPWLKHHPLVKNSEAVFGDEVTSFLNDADVRSQLHISSEIESFEQCSNFVFENYHLQIEGSLWIYKVLRGSGIKMLHYSGDTDAAVPTYGTKQWIKKLNFPLVEKWQPWYTNAQVSGYIEKYDGLDFVTIKGVGHMAPQWAREPVLQLLNQFIAPS